MSGAERPDRLAPGHRVTVEDIRELVGAATPHFALQIRDRVARLIEDLPPGDPARIEGERAIAAAGAARRARARARATCRTTSSRCRACGSSGRRLTSTTARSAVERLLPLLKPEHRDGVDLSRGYVDVAAARPRRSPASSAT